MNTFFTEISVSTTSTSPKSTILSRIVSRASTPSVKGQCWVNNIDLEYSNKTLKKKLFITYYIDQVYSVEF